MLSIGCFNITLYAYFDIHRIFDLILFSIWDFILWWFDLDFVLFDYNFDFILCLSFLFIFVMHFFMNVLFSFLTNFVLLNSIYNTYNSLLVTFFGILMYITFTFIGIVQILLHSIELFIGLMGLFLQDFQSFSDFNHLLPGNTTNHGSNSYFFVLFYFILVTMIHTWILLLRYFYTQSYQVTGVVDTHLTNNSIDMYHVNLINLYILDTTIIENNQNSNLYGYLLTLCANVLIINSLLGIFYNYNTYSFNILNLNFNAITVNNAINLCNLTLCYVLAVHSNPFSEITWMLLIPYIIFTLNFFGTFVNDYTYINIIYNPTTLLFQFTLGLTGFTICNFNSVNKQLQYTLI